MPAREHFRFYASQFDTVELNNSFYRQPTRERFEAWAQSAPPGFLFAVKGSRFVSHVRRMAVAQESIDRVVDGARGLGPMLGPILFQFEDNFRRDLARLDAFLPMLPRTERFTLEFRHESWLQPSVYERLRRCGVALCIPDHPQMPQAFELTADFTYVRLHSSGPRIAYGPPRLRQWAERIEDWRGRGLDVHVYFNNDADAHAVRDARTLKELVGATSS